MLPPAGQPLRSLHLRSYADVSFLYWLRPSYYVAWKEGSINITTHSSTDDCDCGNLKGSAEAVFDKFNAKEGVKGSSGRGRKSKGEIKGKKRIISLLPMPSAAEVEEHRKRFLVEALYLA